MSESQVGFSSAWLLLCPQETGYNLTMTKTPDFTYEMRVGPQLDGHGWEAKLTMLNGEPIELVEMPFGFPAISRAWTRKGAVRKEMKEARKQARRAFLEAQQETISGKGSN